MGAKSPGRIEPKFFLEEDIPDLITCFKFGDDRFRGLASAEGQILPLPIDFDGRPYNILTHTHTTLPCERVITFCGCRYIGTQCITTAELNLVVDSPLCCVCVTL